MYMKELLTRFARFAMAEGGSIPDAIGLLRAVRADAPLAAHRVRLVLANGDPGFEFNVREKMLKAGFTQQEVSEIFIEASMD